MPEISAIWQKFLKSEYAEFHSASFSYSSSFPLRYRKSQIKEYQRKRQKFLSYVRNFCYILSGIKILIFCTLTIFPREANLRPKYQISLQMAEISAICQKFLHPHIQKKIPHLLYIDHFPSRSVFGAKMRNFTKTGRNFCHMPEISGTT